MVTLMNWLSRAWRAGILVRDDAVDVFVGCDRVVILVGLQVWIRSESCDLGERGWDGRILKAELYHNY